ncbi:MAG: hypothetical protein CM1200mP2_54110 [Planctomycetaceae bacterium]|nr:MAG: hypothetical protein CM1200mP2_54110 [Planctomycetaceae bacterium]
MVGGWKDRGIMFTVGTNAGADWLYPDQVWWCIWYAQGKPRRTRMLKLRDSVMAVYHWMEGRRRSHGSASANDSSAHRLGAGEDQSGQPTEICVHVAMSDAYQLPHIPAAPAASASRRC